MPDYPSPVHPGGTLAQNPDEQLLLWAACTLRSCKSFVLGGTAAKSKSGRGWAPKVGICECRLSSTVSPKVLETNSSELKLRTEVANLKLSLNTSALIQVYLLAGLFFQQHYCQE